MPSSLSGEDRAKVIANNRSLRIIKNELEALIERDFITDEQYDLIMKSLPAEALLHNTVLPIPGRNSTTTSPPTSLTDGFSAMSVNSRTSSVATTQSSQPASYNQTPASLPPRNQPQRNEIAHVVALYRYSDPDPRDLNFETGDHISITEYCNHEWWQGKNVRTGEEGIFPKNYVRVENIPSVLAPPNNSNGKVGGYMYGGAPQQPVGGYYPGQQQQQQQQQQQHPGPSNPYNAPVPPMQLAEQLVEHTPSKGAEMGKKFGKRLGNAAIFGAGATLGSEVVSTIL